MITYGSARERALKRTTQACGGQSSGTKATLCVGAGGLYVPVDYKFSFQHGVPQHTAILHDTESYSVINARLAEVEGAKEP